MMSRRGLLFVPLLVVMVPFLVFPAALGLLASFTNYAPVVARPRVVGLDNYAAVFGDPQFLAAIRNIVIFALTVPIELGIGFGVAYLLREPFAGRGLVRVALLLPWLVSPVANGVMWHFLFNGSTGLLGFGQALVGLSPGPSPLGISGLALPAAMATDIWRKAPLAGFLLLPGLAAIPRERWENAILEGASPARLIRDVALPELRPLLFTVALLLTGDALGTFDSLLILTGGGPGSETLTPGLYSYQKAFRENNWPAGATGGWIIGALVSLAGIAYLRATRRLRSAS